MNGAIPFWCRPQFLRDLLLRRRLADRAHVVGHLGATEEPKRVAHPLEGDGRHLAAFLLLRERQQQVVGRLTELFPIELQEGRSMEDRPGRIDARQLGPITSLEVTGVLAEDHTHRFIVRAAAEPHRRPAEPR